VAAALESGDRRTVGRTDGYDEAERPFSRLYESALNSKDNQPSCWARFYSRTSRIMRRLCTGCAALSFKGLYYCCDIMKYARTNRRDLFRLFIAVSVPSYLPPPQETFITLRMS
jgi:hypothetical protein